MKTGCRSDLSCSSNNIIRPCILPIYPTMSTITCNYIFPLLTHPTHQSLQYCVCAS
jgi:hypothetical protein